MAKESLPQHRTDLGAKLQRARIRRELLEGLPEITETDLHETFTPGRFLTRQIVLLSDISALIDRICPGEG